MSHITRIAALTAVFATLLPACNSDHKGWGITGEIEGAQDTVMVIQGVNNGRWYTVDTVQVKGGKFNYQSPAPAEYPDVMRMSMGKEYIYFPVDSVEQIHLRTNLAGFSTDYNMTGSDVAETLSTLDSLITAAVAAQGAEAVVADAGLKAQLFTRAFTDKSVLPVYYLINRSVVGKQLFDLSVPADVRVFGAVAQRFAVDRPDDPRGQLLAVAYKQARTAGQSGAVQTIEVEQTGVIDFSRSDIKGKVHSLAEEASKGNVVILNFTNYGIEAAPAYNVVLNTLYDKYHEQGLEVYQLAFDADETQWRMTAKNLPWIAVWNSTTDDLAPIRSYNVGAMPQSFIIDRQGTLRQRVTDPTELESAVKKYL